MFGTAVIGEERPRVYGVDGLHVRESLVDQFVSPFRQLRRGAPAQPAREKPIPADSTR